MPQMMGGSLALLLLAAIFAVLYIVVAAAALRYTPPGFVRVRRKPGADYNLMPQAPCR